MFFPIWISPTTFVCSKVWLGQVQAIPKCWLHGISMATEGGSSNEADVGDVHPGGLSGLSTLVPLFFLGGVYNGKEENQLDDFKGCSHFEKPPLMAIWWVLYVVWYSWNNCGWFVRRLDATTSTATVALKFLGTLFVDKPKKNGFSHEICLIWN